MKNRINQLFQNKQKNILSIYFTAGYPNLHDTVPIIHELQASGVDLIEIGMPFSDPLADGPTIQQSSKVALDNGMSVQLLFEQLEGIRKTIKIPLILMGYINPVLQFGIADFCKKCNETGIDGVILPDLPLDIYEEKYKKLFEQNNLKNIHLITPQTSDERIKKIDNISNSFIYAVSTSSTTGNAFNIESQQDYFERINQLNLKNPFLIGFGIKDNSSFQSACRFSSGAIIGSEFIRKLAKGNSSTDIRTFINEIVNP